MKTNREILNILKANREIARFAKYLNKTEADLLENFDNTGNSLYCYWINFNKQKS